MAEEKEKIFSTRQMFSKMSEGNESIFGFGEFSVQCVFPLAVLCGLLGKVERDCYAQLSKRNGASDWLDSRGCHNPEDRERLLRSISYGLGQTMGTIENTFCEKKRGVKRIDYFFEGQRMWDIQMSGNSNNKQWTVMELLDNEWTPINASMEVSVLLKWLMSVSCGQNDSYITFLILFM